MNFFDYNGMNTGNSQNGNDYHAKFEQYADKSENELLLELSQVANKMKRDGTFDVGELENFYVTASPYLNDEQRNRMKSIINMLKK